MSKNYTKGEIYVATCKENGKQYIGQAVCYLLGGKIWGAENRWKSHLNEALSDKQKDHSLKLNDAIRMYGRNGFTIRVLKKCKIEKMDYYENKYIELLNTIHPNGFNVFTGGLKGRCIPNNEIIKKFIKPIKKNNETIGYKIFDFPNGINYVNKPFLCQDNPTKALKKAKKYLKELKNNYGPNGKPIEKKRIIRKNAINLPEYIYEIRKNGILTGYFVDNFHDPYGTIYEKKIFEYASTMHHNLNAAKNYVKELEIKNKDLSYVVPKLPKFMKQFKDKAKSGKKVIGFKIIYPLVVNGEPKLITKKFSNMSLTIKEKYEDAMDCYKQLEKGIIPEKKKRKAFTRKNKNS